MYISDALYKICATTNYTALNVLSKS